MTGKNTLIADNNSDTIDNIADMLRFVFAQSDEDEGIHPGAAHALKMSLDAVLSLKEPPN